MKLIGTPEEIENAVAMDYPEVYKMFDRVRERVPQTKREILRHEAAVLYMLARDRDRDGAHFLEIGTALGYSAAVMAEAAPAATIVTLNPKATEYERAVVHLGDYGNVIPLMEHSWDYLEVHRRPYLDFVFVDGDHDQVERDLPWFRRLLPGGLILFHDYSPTGSKRPCQQVVDAVDTFARTLDKEPDVLVVDDRQRGMIGFVKE